LLVWLISVYLSKDGRVLLMICCNG